MPAPEPEPQPEPMTPRVDPIDNILEELGDKDMPDDDEAEGEIVPVEPKPSFAEDDIFNAKEPEAAKEEDVMNSKGTLDKDSCKGS